MLLPLHLLRPDDLFLDIGANVGTYTVLASGVCGARTYAFEPDPGTVCHLRRNIAVNRLNDRVQVYECALGASSGEATFTVGLDTMNRIASPGEKTGTLRMEKLNAVYQFAQPARGGGDSTWKEGNWRCFQEPGTFSQILP